MRKQFLSFIAVTMLIAANTFGQTRYVDDIFNRSEIVRTDDVEYGQNFYFLNYPPAPAGTSSNNPQLGPLQMDLYTPPLTDTETNRPVIVYLHTGSFLPKYFNGSATGKNDDSTVVEMCYRFAQKGYVVAAINYRLGWNPLAPTQTERTQQILNAVYRAIHDAQTAVRFFKKDAATTNNYDIDPDKIFMIGQGSGGYISVAYAFLDKQSETELPKFLDGMGNSVVDPTLVGYVDGIGGTFNNYNHAGYSNSICMAVNMGGAMGDISWMDNIWPKVPVAGVHCSEDPFAPIDSGNVIVPVTGQVVVFVHGTRTVVNTAVTQGLNDIWVNHTFTDPYSTRAYSLNPKITHEGFLELVRPTGQASPWEWWDSTAVTQEATAQGSIYAPTLHTSGLSSNPDMSKTKAIAYIDSIVGFLVPRMYLVYQDPTLSIEDQNENSINFSIYPNPTSDITTIQVEGDNLIEIIEMTDLNGRVIVRMDNLFVNSYTLNHKNLSSGTYIIGIKSAKGNAMKKIIIQ